MGTQILNVPPLKIPVTDGGGNATQPWRDWFQQVFQRTGGTVDKVDAAHATAGAAVPQTTQVVAGGGLQQGGALGGNVAVTLYKVVDVVANLPTTGNSDGDWSYALDGLKAGETSGAGSGVPVWWSTVSGTGGWYVGSGTAVAA